MKFILGTASEWRRDIFRRHFPGLWTSDEESFAVADIDEKAIRHEDPKEMVKLIAAAKADEILKKKAFRDRKDVVLLTCDQVVVFEKAVLEKPSNREEAEKFLVSYRSGSPLECVNGLVLTRLDTMESVRRVEISSVTFEGDSMSDEAIKSCLDSGVGMKASGGVTICDPVMGKWVKSVKGSILSVEGLPVGEIAAMMAELCPETPIRHPRKLGAIRCVLFDMDGLLLDTENAYTVVQQKILDRFGKKFTWEIKSQMMGRKAIDAAKTLIEHFGIGDEMRAEDFVEERERMLDELFPGTDLLPGVERLLLHLHRQGVPMAVATGSHRRHYDLKTTRHRALFEKAFRHVVTGDQVEKAKPNPEIFQRAFEKFGYGKDDVAPEEVLVFEDAPLGVKAGLAAGMKVVMVSSRPPTEELRPHQYLPTLFYFSPEEWGLPAFE